MKTIIFLFMVLFVSSSMGAVGKALRPTPTASLQLMNEFIYAQNSTRIPAEVEELIKRQINKKCVEDFKSPGVHKIMIFIDKNLEDFTYLFSCY